MIKRVGHAAFTPKDMDKTLHFYCDILGFKRLFELNDREGKPWIVYVKVCDGQFIEFFYGGDNEVEINRTTYGYSHLCLEVDDINQIADHLKNHGLTLDVEPRLGIDFNYQCWARDPDGNRIEFMQLMPESPHVRLS